MPQKDTLICSNTRPMPYCCAALPHLLPQLHLRPTGDPLVRITPALRPPARGVSVIRTTRRRIVLVVALRLIQWRRLWLVQPLASTKNTWFPRLQLSVTVIITAKLRPSSAI
jgi:hypothetical protein